MLQQSFQREAGIGQVGELSESHREVLQDLSEEEVAAVARIQARMESFEGPDQALGVGFFYY